MKGDHSPKELHCFKREIENTARLEHPGIVKIIEYYLETAPYWIVMPLYKMSLKEMLPTIKGDSQRTLKVFGAILDGVEFAHAQQIVHRDLKPEASSLIPTMT